MNRLDDYPSTAADLGNPSELLAADHTDMLGCPAETFRMLVDRAHAEPDSLTDEDAVVLNFFSSHSYATEGLVRSSTYAA